MEARVEHYGGDEFYRGFHTVEHWQLWVDDHYIGQTTNPDEVGFFEKIKDKINMPTSYPGLDHFLSTYDEAFVEYDRNRLGGTAKADPKQDTLDEVVVSPHAVFIFENKVVIIAKDGKVIEVDK